MKNFSIATIILIFIISCGKKEDHKTNQLTAKEGSKNITVDVSDFDRYEGKIVKSTIGQWYLIKEGSRWRTNSIEATEGYLKKVQPGPDYIDENVPVEVLQQFPEVGELLPNLVFKKDKRGISQ